MGKTGKPVILSTGMASHEDIEEALKVLGDRPENIIILQCTSQYPADLEKVNLGAMKTLQERGKIQEDHRLFGSYGRHHRFSNRFHPRGGGYQHTLRSRAMKRVTGPDPWRKPV